MDLVPCRDRAGLEKAQAKKDITREDSDIIYCFMGLSLYIYDDRVGTKSQIFSSGTGHHLAGSKLENLSCLCSNPTSVVCCFEFFF